MTSTGKSPEWRSNRQSERRPPDARFRYGDVFTLKKNRSKVYTVDGQLTFCNTLYCKRNNIVYEFPADKMEWLLQNGDILILKDGPESDPRKENDWSSSFSQDVSPDREETQ